ncbi:ArsR/SmtB family transcription factor [Halomonas sp. 328]|uniref:ArsR/SmtB family transcription factor n=1 Tax=Halomonas sp. 328 TaxID=2776704 RepID=UPI0018A72E8B|nr:helix-turn-helix transcriptional regulator [Halomonas sp. 328]MBF8221852.1 helix-turn-helix transcriptional regulator [Halomonas sp. 328]
MDEEPDLARLARTLGDPTRLGMLALLMEGRALTAKELAYGTGVQPGTATAHLRRLQEDALLGVARQGRHKYYRLATPAVARAVESLMVVARPVRVVPPRRQPQGALAEARYCYDHLAGRLGTGISEALFIRGWLRVEGERWELTADGERWCVDFGLDPAALRRRRRRFAYPCLDWSERCDHLGGALGAALAERLEALGWVARQKGTRVVTISAEGREGLAREFALTLSGSEETL